MRSILELRSEAEALELEPARKRLADEPRRLPSSSVDFTRLKALRSEGRRACRLPDIVDDDKTLDGVLAADEVDVDGDGGAFSRDPDL